jgi:NADH-quinone oxidoreductase subunit N
MTTGAIALLVTLVTAGLFALLGIFIMISGNNFLVIYLGLELLTLTSYALVALRRDNGNATEAAMKYFLMGSFASGVLLFGIALVYGETGSFDIFRIGEYAMNNQPSLLYYIGGLMILIAI